MNKRVIHVKKKDQAFICEQNDRFTHKPLIFKKPCLQIRCLRIRKKAGKTSIQKIYRKEEKEKKEGQEKKSSPKKEGGRNRRK